MKKYKNKAGDSGITAYETGPNWIKIRFISGDVYLYSYIQPGEQDVEHMKRLAESGNGLATYISQYVRDRYERKL